MERTANELSRKFGSVFVTNEALVKSIQEGREVKQNQELLWTRNIKLIRLIIRKLTGYHENEYIFQDMEQQAFLGMLEAIERYDSSKGIKFFSYAASWIRQSIYRYNDNGGYNVRIPTYMRDRMRRYMAARSDFIMKYDRKPTDEELRGILGFAPAAFDILLKTIHRKEVMSLDEYIKPNGEESGPVLDMVQGDDDVERSGIESVYLQELHEVLFKALGNVSESGREIIIAYYFQGHSIRHISRARGCTTKNVANHMKLAYKAIRKG